MIERVEASPYNRTVGDETVKNELYLKYFDVKHLGNIKGSMPLLGVDFNETESAYAKRLRVWKQADYDVLFSDWKIKDLKHFQVATNNDGDTLHIEPSSYSITTAGKEFHFPVLPETIDDFINDCKRIGLKLFWKQEIIDKFGADRISSETKVIEYHKILRQSLS